MPQRSLGDLMDGASIEIGAFVAGLMIAEVEHSEHALGKMLPLRDTFACLFFASLAC
jgi:CPA2 family monovalent cation:H+ antiporter-2